MPAKRNISFCQYGKEKVKLSLLGTPELYSFMGIISKLWESTGPNMGNFYTRECLLVDEYVKNERCKSLCSDEGSHLKVYDGKEYEGMLGLFPRLSRSLFLLRTSSGPRRKEKEI